jgi:hypothetical protein
MTEAEVDKEAVMGEAGWHPDPHHRHELRWWDGATWTDHVSDAGVASVDPVLAASTPSFAPPSFAPPAVSQPTVAQPTVAQPASGPPVLPVQPMGSGPDQPKRGWWIAAVLGVLAVGVGVAVVLSLGGDDETASDTTEESTDDTTDDTTDETTDDTDAVDTTVVVTTASPTTVAVTEAPTSVAPTTPPTTPPTEAPVTVPPTAAPVVPTVDVLVAALPTAAEVPPGFTASLEPPDTDFSPASGQGIGLCGGDNSDARAQAANVIARAWTSGYDAPAGFLWVGLFSFPTPADASAFMTITATQATVCGAGLTFQSPESEWDIFSDDVDATWNIVENAGAGPATSPAEEAFQLTTQFVSTTRLDGVNYSSTDGDVIQYERYGSVVVLYDRSGSWNPVGFGNISASSVYQPTGADVAALADTLRGPLLDRLRAAGVIA